MGQPEYLVEKADECFRLAKLAKQAGESGVEVAANLEAMGNEFMAKAVELETVRQKVKKQA